MKKILIALIVGLFVFGFSSLAFAQNLVSNPGFENWTGGEPDNWTYESGVTFTQETTTVHGGSSSAYVYLTTQDQSNTDTQNTEAAVSAGDPYTCSVWVYDNDPAGRVTMVLYWNGASPTYTGQYSSDQASWQQLTYTGSVPTGVTGVQVGFRFYDVEASWDGDAEFYVDDYSFEITGAEIIKAYSISSNEVDIEYNADLTSVDPADYSLTGTANITFSSATIDGSNAKLVHLTGASASMTGDTTVDNIADAANSTNYDFYAGIMPIANTNTNNLGGHIDNTHLATFQGIVSANDAYNNVWVSDAIGAYNGVLVFDYDFDSEVTVGDEILFTAIRDEYLGLTELTDPTLLETISSGNTPYGPTIIDGSDINENITVDTNPGEKWEGQLVKIENFYVESSGNYYYRCTDDGGTTYFYVGDNVDYHLGVFSLTVGATYQEMTGVVDWYNSGPYYRINPRDNDDQTLPVELSSFTAVYTINEADMEYVLINWKTASETDVQGFYIYRSENDDINTAGNPINYELIDGHGNSSITQSYTFEDITANVLNNYYYWLEVVNLGGMNDIHGPIEYKSIDIDGNGELNIITGNLNPCFPNPVQLGDEIRFKFMVGGLEGNTKYVELKVYNVLGELVREIVNEEKMIDEYTETWVPRNLSPGVYLYQLKTDNFNEVKKLVIVR